ncbi:Excitatory amino acid transporter 3 [Halotydeus destructor]|nr:Excitatory amino acid transporter 3 [Halotydeus destructor]
MGFGKFYTKNVTGISIASVFLAVILGVICRTTGSHPWSDRHLMYIGFTGDMYLRGLTCIILPLIVSSVVTSLGTLDPKLTAKIGARAVAYYLTTTVSAIFLGLVLVTTIRPGARPLERHLVPKSDQPTTTAIDSLLDLLRNLVPNNIMDATLHQSKTVLTQPKGSNETDIYKWTISSNPEPSTNIIGLITVSILIGIALSRLQEKGKAFLDMFSAMSHTFMLLTEWVILLTPIGVLFLILPQVLKVDNFENMMSNTGLYLLTAVSGHIIHGFLVLPFYYYLVTRENPYSFMTKIIPAMLTAFSTASSTATLSVTVKCLENNLGLDQRIINFLAPVGATINMDGNGVDFTVAAIYVAQSQQISLGIGQLVIIGIAVAAASVGSAGIPNAGIVMIMLVLNAAGLPTTDIGIILLADWVVDRTATVINVIGDCYGAAVLQHLSKDDLANIDGPAYKKVVVVQGTNPQDEISTSPV